MGLRLLLRDGETHPIFDDPLFGRSQAWMLSTSGLSAGDKFFGTGFGTIWPDGYGINCSSSSRTRSELGLISCCPRPRRQQDHQVRHRVKAFLPGNVD